jgi:uncharacterized repeat protein (TIGR03803 family)
MPGGTAAGAPIEHDHELRWTANFVQMDRPCRASALRKAVTRGSLDSVGMSFSSRAEWGQHMIRNASSSFKFAIRAAFAILIGLGLVGAASAGSYKMKTLYYFCPNGSCTDGAPPNDLAIGPDGKLYGATSAGGAYTWGTVYRLSPTAHGWRHDVLYSFCRKLNCTDGGEPNGHLIFDQAGNIFGTTQWPNAVFELSPPVEGKKVWTERVVYTFKGDQRPATGLTYPGAAAGGLYDDASPVYGATIQGGSNFKGTIYQLVPAAKKWLETDLYAFCSQDKCADGAYPTQAGSLALDSGGNLYGTTNLGGANNQGTAFMLHPNSGQWSETVLHDFGDGRNDGSQPLANLVLDQAGNLYGITPFGGANLGGVLFKIEMSGGQATYSTIYDFCSKSLCTDGQTSFGALSIDASGTLFGSTRSGGTSFDGTVFEFGQSLRVLRSFCLKPDCADGGYPEAGVAIDASGNLFGTTSYGGVNNNLDGTAFELSP